MITRRNVIGAAAAAGGAAILNQVGLLAPKVVGAGEPAGHTGEATPPLPPAEPGRDYTPVFTPNGATLEYRVMDGVKVMHLIAGEIEHEFAPGLRAKCWGYNGRTPGPTIEAVAGDRLRFYVTNRLPAPTTVHWH
ncbi:MAG TPA: multicopper oxidase domain-containing protein, partial [Tepidisphaeraceae bacterium]